MNLNNYYNAKELVSYYQSIKQAQGNFLGARFFPEIQQQGVDLSWIKGYQGKNVALKPSAFDVKAPIRSQQGSKQIATSLPLFKEGMLFQEKQRRRILENIRLYGEENVEKLLLPIYKQYAELVDGASVQAERMRMLLLSGETIHIVSNDSVGATTYDYNYDVDGQWSANNKTIIAGAGQWTSANAATSDPVNDLIDAIDTHADMYGSDTAILLMNSVTFRAIMASESVTKRLRPHGGLVSKSEVKSLIETEAEAEVLIYNKSFLDEAGAGHKFYPDGLVTLLPSDPVGQTVYGTTPTEFDLLQDPASKDHIAITDLGVAVQTIFRKDPVNVETIVSALVLPSFESMDSVAVVKGF